MKNTILSVLVLLALSSCCVHKGITSKQNPPTLSKVVEAVQSEYTNALSRFRDSGVTNISLSEADLTLTTSEALSGSADITILIFKPSAKYTRTKSTAITYTLSEQAPPQRPAVPRFVLKNTHELADLIVKTAMTFQNLKPTIGDLTRNNFVIDLVFSIENDDALGLTFTVWGLGADAGLESDNIVTHELKLTFNYK